MIRVIVTGACGRMGREVLRAIWNTDDIELVGAVDPNGNGIDIGTFLDTGKVGILAENNLEDVLLKSSPDLAVDFTGPQTVYKNTISLLNHGVRPVVGTSGMNVEQINNIIKLSEKLQVGGVIAPNFAIGALLMMKFSAEAIKYLPFVEIIELHHDQKVDSPSGTAIKTAEAIVEQLGNDSHQGLAGEIETISGARGAKYTDGIRIHSVRLPGLVAHQEVIFGGLGQTLTIRHDSSSRESFMPGVLLGIRKSMHLRKVVYGLDKILFECKG